MIFTLRRCLILAAGCAIPAALQAQFSIDGHPIQVHGFASQGFSYSNQNNYLTMNTSSGSFAFTDGGINVSTSFSDKFRVGAQGYVRNIGQLGHGHVSLDWAFGDYKFKDWLGIRAGKVKTALGLFNDTQDMEFLHTWAVLPQSLYPLDLRASMIAHTGGDVYGEIPLRKAGSVSYTGYFGRRSDDPRGGYYYNTADAGSPIKDFTGNMGGFDARWNTPVSGLLVGGSWMALMNTINGTSSQYGLPYTVKTDPQHITSVYADFSRGKWRFNAEFRRNHEEIAIHAVGPDTRSDSSDKGWFASGAYRITKRLEVGTYHSRFYIDVPNTPDPNGNHIFDQTVTGRFDIAKWWNVKVEGHFIDGYGDIYSAHGFYQRSNPKGLKPTTNLLVIRTGFNF
jgi:hypothetical protein